MSKIANFFWQGKISLFEYHCINSFIKQGFQVKVWTFDNLELPPGCSQLNAEHILSKDRLLSITMNKQKGSLAGFADLFRYHLLSKEEGWWFDADCVCLKSVDEFDNLSNTMFVAGWEDRDQINNAVLFMNQNLAQQIVNEAELICQNKDNILTWGEIGPKMITRLVKEYNLESYSLSERYFYPIHYKNALLALDPTFFSALEISCKDSYVYHTWNEILNKHNINKNIMPITGSFLHKIFNQ